MKPNDPRASTFKVGERRFIKTTFTGLDNRPMTCFKQDSPLSDSLALTVTPSGLKISGQYDGEISTEAELQQFAALISTVWTERLRLAPKLATSLAGH